MIATHHFLLCFVLLLLACGNYVEKPGEKLALNSNAESIIKPDSFPEKINYAWGNSFSLSNTLKEFVSVPEGYARIKTGTGTFAEWLRYLPIKSGDTQVTLYNGKEKSNQSAQHAIVDIDVGDRDLQQCADAVIRLRAEYLFSSGREELISFNFTSGDPAKWVEWKKGKRPIISGNNVTWKSNSAPGSSYDNFKKYLQTVFTYAGTASLSKELHLVSMNDIQPGDVFIQGGFPGHAVLVLDVAINSIGERIFLIGQSYMPAQEFHVLKNTINTGLSPWYRVKDYKERIPTPEWEFATNNLKRFRN